MINALRTRLTFSNVAASIAVFLALGGGIAWALSNNSVKSRHIKDGQVKTQDLGDGAVTTAKLAPGTLAGTTPVTVGLANGGPNCGAVTDAWIDQSANVNHEAGYSRDASGFVVLQGVVRRCGTATETVFTLPAGFRPDKLTHFASFNEPSDFQEIQVYSNGDVTAPGAPIDQGVFLDGITFRCLPAGANGCP